MTLNLYNRYLSRLLLIFSDLCDTDDEIADCLTLMRVQSPAKESQWTASAVRALMPSAFATANSESEFSAHPNKSTLAYCAAVAKAVKNRKAAK